MFEIWRTTEQLRETDCLDGADADRQFIQTIDLKPLANLYETCLIHREGCSYSRQTLLSFMISTALLSTRCALQFLAHLGRLLAL